MSPRPGIRRITTTVAATTTLAAAVGVGYALGHDGGRTAPPTSPPIALANADLTVAASCEDLLDSIPIDDLTANEQFVAVETGHDIETG